MIQDARSHEIKRSLVYGCADVCVPHCCQPFRNCGSTSCDKASIAIFSFNPWITEKKKILAFTERIVPIFLKLFSSMFGE
jgi:hypothetical protein